MSEHKHDWLQDIPLDDDLWLEMLIDGELTAQQRSGFITHTKRTDAWQRVATAFLDNQVLAEAVPFEPDFPKVAPEPGRTGDRARHQSLVVAVACLVCGLFFGSMMMNPGPEDAVLATNDNVTSDVEPTATATGRETLPALYQVRDTPAEAVYYVDCEVPRFLLESLVLAGHNVKLEQEFLGYTESPNSPAAVPINVLRIEKYGRLMAAAQPSAGELN